MNTTELIAGYTQYTTAEEFADAAHDNSAPATTPSTPLCSYVSVVVSVDATYNIGC
ncbi:LxmA leader domain family RiPP [Streptomyces sp. NPDC006649]|uniref:LxmA leader domain family RiPP n=1 Tax=Streptomyces sp. NPDC006649 TaxID=3156896 RepID=UPI00339F9534